MREAGGLHVIGTERHESRRVDNQLRGRAAARATRGPRASSCWGQPAAHFEAIVAGLMNAFRVAKTCRPNWHATRSLEGAQKKVETYYYDIRKQVFEYDEVMNNQRKAVYSERRRVLMVASSRSRWWATANAP